MDDGEAYRWAEIFCRDWNDLSAGMADRATALGLDQVEVDGTLVWNRDSEENCRWVFVDDPSDVDGIRSIYLDDGNVASPSCFVVVRQPDPSDDRGEIIFDIFRLSPESYLWHYNRVYTPPA